MCHKWHFVRLAKITENDNLRHMASCIVSYIDTSGIRHAVELQADSLYEAGVLALKVFKQNECEPGDISKLEIEVRSSVIHTVSVRQVKEWLNGGARSPKEAITKDRLRGLL